MGGLFSKPKTPDMSAQIAQQERALKLQEESMARQEQMLKDQEARLQQEETDRMKQLQGRRKAMSRGGMTSLLSPDRPVAEKGITPLSQSLGG
jgi:hypothetical protein